MARKAKSDQRDTPTDYVCAHCKADVCACCLEVTRRRAFDPLYSLCKCKRSDHEAEVTAMVNLAREEASESFPPTYRYRDAQLVVMWQTSVPKDDEAALAYFHSIVRFGPDFKPVYCERITRDESGEHYTMLTEVFDPQTFQTKPFGMDALL